MKYKLNKLESAQVLDAIKAGCTVKLTTAPRSKNKGWTDTPLYRTENQQKLFQ